MANKVDDYIEKQGSPQREIVQELRGIIIKTLPGVKEEFKMGVPWYGKYYIVALKGHVNLGFSVAGLSNEDKALFEGEGKLMRHIKIRSLNGIDEGKIAELLKLVQSKTTDCKL